MNTCMNRETVTKENETRTPCPTVIISLETVWDYPPSRTYTKDCVMFHQHRFVTVKDLCLKESWTDKVRDGQIGLFLYTP